MNHQFALYTTAEMTTLAGSRSVVFDGTGDVEWTLYFGCPSAAVKLETAENAGIDAVTLTPVSQVAVRQNQTAYAVGDMAEPAGGNGYFYVCRTAGESGGSPPNWIAKSGARVQDGGVVWHCGGRRLRPEDVKLAASAEGLDTARGGAPLSLGVRVLGGTALPVHVRFADPQGSLYDYPDSPQIGLSLNPCYIKAVQT